MISEDDLQALKNLESNIDQKIQKIENDYQNSLKAEKQKNETLTKKIKDLENQNNDRSENVIVSVTDDNQNLKMLEKLQELDISYKKSELEKNDQLVKLIEEQNKKNEVQQNFEKKLLEANSKIDGLNNQLTGEQKYMDSQTAKNAKKEKEIENLKKEQENKGQENREQAQSDIIIEKDKEIENLKNKDTETGLLTVIDNLKKDLKNKDLEIEKLKKTIENLNDPSILVKNAQVIAVDKSIGVEDAHVIAVDKSIVVENASVFTVETCIGVENAPVIADKKYSKVTTKEIHESLESVYENSLHEAFKSTPANLTFQVLKGDFKDEKIEHEIYIEVKYKNQVCTTKRRTGRTPDFEEEKITIHKFQPSEIENLSIKAFQNKEILCMFPINVIILFLLILDQGP